MAAEGIERGKERAPVLQPLVTRSRGRRTISRPAEQAQAREQRKASKVRPLLSGPRRLSLLQPFGGRGGDGNDRSQGLFRPTDAEEEGKGKGD